MFELLQVLVNQTFLVQVLPHEPVLALCQDDHCPVTTISNNHNNNNNNNNKKPK